MQLVVTNSNKIQIFEFSVWMSFTKRQKYGFPLIPFLRGGHAGLSVPVHPGYHSQNRVLTELAAKSVRNNLKQKRILNYEYYDIRSTSSHPIIEDPIDERKECLQISKNSLQFWFAPASRSII